jgi:hypothetical protein
MQLVGTRLYFIPLMVSIILKESCGQMKLMTLRPTHGQKNSPMPTTRDHLSGVVVDKKIM